LFDPRWWAGRDPVNEHRAAHEPGRQRTDQRPRRAGPLVHDRDVYAARRVDQPPSDVHPPRDTPHVPAADYPRPPVHGHLRHPPRGEPEDAEGARSRHFHGAAAVPALEEAHPPVVREDLRPALHVRCHMEHPIDGRPDHYAVDGDHAATIRAPRLYRATVGTPACRSMSSNSAFVYPRLSDTTASCRVTPLIARPTDAAHTPAMAARDRRRSASTTARRATRSNVAIQRTAAARGTWCSTWLATITSTERGPSGSQEPSATIIARPPARAKRAAVRLRSMPIGVSSTPWRRAAAPAARGVSPSPVPVSNRVHVSRFPFPVSRPLRSKKGSSSCTTARVPPNHAFSRAISRSSFPTA